MSFDTVEENRAFAEKFEYPFLLLSDPDRSIGMAYHAADERDQKSARRISYVIDPRGTIERVYETVDVSTHPDQILRDLRDGD